MDQSINVVFMGNFLYPHGMADSKRIQYFIDFLIKKSVTVKVLLLRQGGIKLDTHETIGKYKGVVYRTIGNNIRMQNTIYKLPEYLCNGVITLIQWRSGKSKNILYSYGGLSLENIIFLITAKILGYSVIFDIVEENMFLEEKLHFLARVKWITSEWMGKHLSKFANALVVISEYLKKNYEKAYGNRIPVVHIPISAQCYETNPERRKESPIKIVYAGSFAKKDGVEQLIEAFKNVYKVNNDCQLLLSGKGANLPHIQNLIAGDPAIRHMGYLNDAEFRDFLEQADILCITRVGSKYANAGFPFKLGEYLATGNPVVVSDVSDVSIYLENKKDAIITEPDSVKAIEDALLYCIYNPKLAKSIGVNGREKCRIHFNPDTNGQTLFSLLTKM